MMTSCTSMALSSVPIKVVAATIRGGKVGAPAARPVDAAGSPVGAPLVVEEAMAFATVVVSGTETPSPSTATVGEP
jgi:hypothetical protein